MIQFAVQHFPTTRHCKTVGALAGAVILTGAFDAAARPTKVVTTTAEWNAGELFNTVGVDDDEDGRLQLVEPGDVRTFPFLWPANAGEDTVTKFDANINKEVGRYRTWFDPGAIHGAWTGPAPSRTSVDAEGNVYVVNRHFDSKPISVMKILASDAGAVDRNGNGVIDTCSDGDDDGVVTGGEILPVNDDGGASAGAAGGIAGDGIPQIEEFHDERIAWIVQIPGTVGHLGRSCAIAPDGAIWVGSYSPGNYYRLDSATGAVLGGPYPTGATPYGAVIDSSGMLYGANLSSILTEFDTTSTPPALVANRSYRSNYGIALDDARNKVYLGNNNPYTIFDTVTKTFSNSPPGPFTRGIAVAANGDVLTHSSDASFPNYVPGSPGSRGVTRWRPDGSVVWSSGAQPGATDTQTRGVAPDANGDIFTANLDNWVVCKYRGSDGSHLGVFPIGARPYSYSDFSGSSFIQTNLIGTWTQECASPLSGAKNCIVTWDGMGPGSIKVELAGSDTEGAPGPFVEASNGAVVDGVAGKYITVKVTLQAEDQKSPSVKKLTLECCPQIGDFNDDCCVDLEDYNELRAAYLGRSDDSKYDVNGDGVLNIADLRREVKLFCNPGGEPCPPREMP